MGNIVPLSSMYVYYTGDCDNQTPGNGAPPLSLHNISCLTAGLDSYNVRVYYEAKSLSIA